VPEQPTQECGGGAENDGEDNKRLPHGPLHLDVEGRKPPAGLACN
jgi:hypothetical protein